MMKNLICVLFLLTVGALSPMRAQSIYLTPRAGLNMANITNTGGSVRSGLNFGISGEYVHVTGIAAEVGIYYSMQGSTFRSEDVSPEHNYVTIPFLFKYYIEPNSSITGENRGFNVFAGPQLDFKGADNKVSFDKSNKGALLPEAMTRAMGASAVIGAGYLFDMGVMVSANVNIGLTNKAKAEYNNFDLFVKKSEGSYKDFVIQFNFGYRFVLP
jgi:hypothetical protein